MSDISLSGEALEAVLVDARRWRNFRAFAGQLGGEWKFEFDGDTYIWQMGADILDRGADTIIETIRDGDDDE